MLVKKTSISFAIKPRLKKISYVVYSLSSDAQCNTKESL